MADIRVSSLYSRAWDWSHRLPFHAHPYPSIKGAIPRHHKSFPPHSPLETVTTMMAKDQEREGEKEKMPIIFHKVF